MQCELSFMSAAIFRLNFVLMLAQSIINTLMGVVCVQFIYANVQAVAGWNKQEMMVLLSTSLIVNQLFRAFVNPNQLAFVQGIGSGAFDHILLRPLSIIYQISAGKVDISALISALAPAAVVAINLRAMAAAPSAARIAIFTMLCVFSLVLLSSFMLTLYSLSFWFVKASGLNNVYYMLMSFSEKPGEIFSKRGISMCFFYVIPAIPLANAPARILLGKGNASLILAHCAITAVFFLLAILAVKTGLRKYSGASS
jgi:ABC-2 type transport system permease protein